MIGRAGRVEIAGCRPPGIGRFSDEPGVDDRSHRRDGAVVGATSGNAVVNRS